MTRSARRGFGALAVVMLFSSIFLIETFAVGDETVLLLHNNSGSLMQSKANFAATAAVQNSLAQLDHCNVYDSVTGSYYSTWDPGESITNVSMPNEPLVCYTIRLRNNSQGLLGANFVDRDGTAVPSGSVYLKATALARPDSSLNGRTYRHDIGSMGQLGSTYWNQVLMAAHTLQLNSSVKVDSFSSGDAVAYPNGATTAGAPLAVVACDAILASIKILDHSLVQGNVTWGPNGTQDSALTLDSTSQVTGLLGNGPRIYTIPRFKPPYNPSTALEVVALSPGETRSLAPGAYKSITVPAGAHLVLQTSNYLLNGRSSLGAPRYFVNDFVVLDGGSLELQAQDAPAQTSRVEFYVGQSFTATDGASVNAWTSRSVSRSNRFQLIYVGDGSPKDTQVFTLDQRSSFAGVVAGAGLYATIDNHSQFFGALRAFAIQVSDGSGVHWDHAIQRDNLIRGLLSWTLQGLINQKTDDNAGLGQAP